MLKLRRGSSQSIPRFRVCFEASARSNTCGRFSTSSSISRRSSAISVAPTSSTCSRHRTSRSCWRPCRPFSSPGCWAAGRPELPQRRGAGSSRTIAGRAVDAARRSSGTSCRRVSSSSVFATFGIDASVIPNMVDTSRFRFRDRVPLQPRILSTRNFDGLYNVACTIRAFQLVQQQFPDATLTLVGGGNEEDRASSARSGARPAGRDVRRTGRPRRHRALLRRARHLPAKPGHRQHADVGHRSVRVRAAGRVDRSRRRACHSDPSQARPAGAARRLRSPRPACPRRC